MTLAVSFTSPLKVGEQQIFIALNIHRPRRGSNLRSFFPNSKDNNHQTTENDI